VKSDILREKPEEDIVLLAFDLTTHKQTDSQEFNAGDSAIFQDSSVI
jgi:hypothetical protein